MNPRLWEELKKNTERAVLESGVAGVRLIGGIMDGWLVLPDADVFKPDWHKSNPPGHTAGPGRYVVAKSGREAKWTDDASAD